MPRLSPSLILRAQRKSSLLPLVLRGTRDLDSAVNELRWLREHVHETLKDVSPIGARRSLLKLCQRRSRDEPLQYILGSQPFGHLDIKCRPRVLIPRPETEAYTTYLADLVLSNSKTNPNINANKLGPHVTQETGISITRILDVCSGSGCISLLLYSLLHKRYPQLQVVGLDISKAAINLANENLTSIFGTRASVKYQLGDIFDADFSMGEKADIIISNPPYISTRKFDTETTRSVRNWEPKIALVPPTSTQLPIGCPAEEDIFYHRLLEMHHAKKSKILLMEVGDEEQALRVVKMALDFQRRAKQDDVEVWRDWPDQKAVEGQTVCVNVNGQEIVVRGAGNMRSVALFSLKMQ